MKWSVSQDETEGGNFGDCWEGSAELGLLWWYGWSVVSAVWSGSGGGGAGGRKQEKWVQEVDEAAIKR